MRKKTHTKFTYFLQFSQKKKTHPIFLIAPKWFISRSMLGTFLFLSPSAEWIIQLLKGMKNKWDGFQNVINHMKFFIFVPHYIYLFDIYLIKRKCTCFTHVVVVVLRNILFGLLVAKSLYVSKLKRKKKALDIHLSHVFAARVNNNLPWRVLPKHIFPVKAAAAAAMFIHRCHLQSNIEMYKTIKKRKNLSEKRAMRKPFIFFLTHALSKTQNSEPIFFRFCEWISILVGNKFYFDVYALELLSGRENGIFSKTFRKKPKVHKTT